VLVLDEPTNHLDIESIGALVEGLRAYEGTVLFVSHDRWFVSQLATRVIEVTAEGLRDFPGTYEEYLARQGDDHLDADAVSLRARNEAREKKAAAGAGEGDGRSKAEQWADEKKRRNRLKELPRRRDKALAEIAAAEARLKELDARLADGDFYVKTGKAEQDAVVAEHAAIGPKIEALMAEWEAIESELAELGGEAAAE
jgi:ABC-type multidrug transport system ATPase subunit